MLPWSVLLEHGIALGLLWGWVALAGIALLPILRLRIGMVGAPLLGIVYWTVALYVLPFAGGLDVAAGLVVVLVALALARWWREGASMSARKRLSWSTLICVIGSLPYTSTLVCHYAPLGMDATMHATNAVLIARAGGLPGSFAPFLPDVAFPAVNLGLPAVASVAIRWGGEPAAVILACHHLTFTSLILATYLLLRWWTGRTSAALLAVVSVWMARSSQNTLAWGGFPTVMSVAIGIFAARLLLQQSRSMNWRSSLAAGNSIAAIPLIHGVGGGTWIYCVGIWISLATLAASRRRFMTLRGLACAGVVAGLVMGAYRLSGPLELEAQDMEKTRFFAQQHAPTEGSLPVWLTSVAYVSKNAENLLVWPGWAALVVLGLRRKWPALLLLGAAWLTLISVVANSRWYILPGSFLLFPERVLYWAGPLCAVGLAISLRGITFGRLPLKRCAISASIGILVLAGYYHIKLYQRFVRAEFISQEGWAALSWAKGNLNPQRDFVAAPYGSAGAFLPAVAQIGCTGTHHHHFVAPRANDAHQRRRITYHLIDRGLDPSAAAPAGAIVFHNRTITIVETP